MSAVRNRRLNRRRILVQAFLLVAFAPGARADDGLFDTQGYRRARYRAAIDRLPDPAARITMAAALEWGDDALFLDVLPAEGALRDAGSGHWTLAEPHETIPGALWFPEVGRAPVDPALWRALTGRVAAWRRDHPHGPIVVFCRADCWMSWNAARRLAREGVAGVTWLPEGIDGWHDAGRALVAVVPEPAAANGTR